VFNFIPQLVFIIGSSQAAFFVYPITKYAGNVTTQSGYFCAGGCVTWGSKFSWYYDASSTHEAYAGPQLNWKSAVYQYLAIRFADL